MNKNKIEQIRGLISQTFDKHMDEHMDELKEAVKGANNWRHFSQDHFLKALVSTPTVFVDFYNMMADNESRECFNWIVGYRVLATIFGEYDLWATMPTTSPLYRLFPGSVKPEDVAIGIQWVQDNMIDMPDYVELYSLWHTFYLQHYKIEGVFEVNAGDIVFDIGAYRGDTAVYFGKKVAQGGHVYSFEPVMAFAEQIKENTKKFNLEEHVTVVPYCLSDKAQSIALSFSETMGMDNITAEAITIDEFVAQNNITKLDMMKLDIEGAERLALKGGRNAIARFRPKIALSIYHSDGYGYRDFYELPALMRDLCPNYRFYLRHKNACLYETVLFCIPN